MRAIRFGPIGFDFGTGDFPGLLSANCLLALQWPSFYNLPVSAVTSGGHFHVWHKLAPGGGFVHQFDLLQVSHADLVRLGVGDCSLWCLSTT